jgi:hypothetical protein
MDQREFFSEATESNRYKLSEVIGKGSYGVVASAVDQFTGGCWPIAGWLVRLRLGWAGLGWRGHADAGAAEQPHCFAAINSEWATGHVADPSKK